MWIIGVIVIGFIAGIIARAIMPGPDPAGCLVTTGLGIAGALMATQLGRFVGWYEAGEAAGFIGAIVGAVLVLGIFRLVRR